ncbi:hypothetical protein KL905_001494 [Ogataea polymorpha]|uniref:uncharacterized protein n=1 Tax=Ogataea polymorpha TaxID=460523 RepID=UPI0007F33EE3|nr:uncharacterized protein OGAPODRAFT_15750 [Ogataea polymorpha]KAG7880001.1 hypothetical protein KL937_002885 [Ogataea polymorpha]KAG7923228.1 hypothetical protein KL905_001494 [Ogataea polymorpha]KAG7929084.1 hypothetical protein KL925_001265 [Ogataea polymorpha]KAG7937884.1 hypothetical protein KL904_002031 [Ogataea polymorpha]KAG7938058.1 hypothetical protein KL934_000632 [Ogataea polymorpha]
MDIEVLETREKAQLEPKKQVSVENEDVELESVGSLLDDDTEKPNAADVATRGQELVDDRTENTVDGESELEYESDHVELEEEEEKEEQEQEPETQLIEEPDLEVKEEEDNNEDEEDEEADEEVGLTDEELAGEEEHEESGQIGKIEENQENQDAPEEDPNEVVTESNGLSYEVPIYIDLGREVYKLVQPSVPEEADFKDLTVLFGEDIFGLSLELFFSRLKAKHPFKEERELILKCSSLGDLTIEEDSIHCSKLSVGDIVDLFKGLRSQSDNPDLYRFIQFEVVTRPRFIMQYEFLKSQLESGKGLESVQWESSTDSLPRKKIKTDVT